MDDEEARFKNESKEYNPEIDTENEGLIESLKRTMKEHKEMHEAYHEEKKLFKSLPKYDRKLLKGIMKGPGKIMILWLIGKERTHGYELMTKLQGDSPAGDNLKVSGPSKIYPILHELEKNELIKGTWEYHGKRKLKYYKITEEGINTLSRIRKISKCREKTQLLEEFMNDMFFNKE